MSQATFKSAILANFRSLWSSQVTTLDFADSMYSSIRRGFNQAWIEGALACNVKANERTAEEQKRLDLLIGDNFQYVGRLADWIFEHSKANGYKFSDITYRADEWIARYTYVQTVCREMACANLKELWSYGASEHCCDCLRMHGRVYRNSIWAKYGIEPQSPNLACFGGHCRCKKTPTDLPVTKGRPPALRGPGGCGKAKKKELT